MKLAIRKAQTEDAAAIAHVHVESWKTTYAGIISDGFLASLNKEDRTISWQEQILGGGITLFVAEDEKGISALRLGGNSERNSTTTKRNFTPSTCCGTDKSKAQEGH